MSLPVHVTVVLPIGKVLPLGGLQDTNGGGLHPPVAELVKNTTAPLGPLAITVMLDEQVRLIGGYCGGLTVTTNEQLVDCPQVSLPVHVTVVVPIGKVLPLGGLQDTNGGGLHPPVAELVKNTTAPLGPVAVTAMLDEQVRLIGGSTTVTVKLQLVLLPQVSLAVANTVVVPIGNVLPLGGLAVTNGGGLQPPLPLTVKKTVAPLELVAVAVMLDGHAMLTGG